MFQVSKSLNCFSLFNNKLSRINCALENNNNNKQVYKRYILQKQFSFSRQIFQLLEDEANDSWISYHDRNYSKCILL